MLSKTRLIASARRDRWRKFDGEIRRYLVRVFPYALLYSIEPEGLFTSSRSFIAIGSPAIGNRGQATQGRSLLRIDEHRIYEDD